MTTDYEVGKALGEAIWACFEAAARIDGVTVDEVIEEWIGAYIAERLTHKDGHA